MKGKKRENVIGNKPTIFRWHALPIKKEDTTKNKMTQQKHIFLSMGDAAHATKNAQCLPLTGACCAKNFFNKKAIKW
jgi:hypothetical protein